MAETNSTTRTNPTMGESSTTPVSTPQAAPIEAQTPEVVKTFTQEDINRIATKEKAEGRKSVLKELGIEDTEDAKKAIKAYLQQQESQKTEAQRATERANQAEKDLNDAKASVAALQQKYDALAAGAKSESMDDLLVLVRNKMNEQTDFTAALELVKQSYPMLFVGNVEAPAPVKNPGTGGASTLRKVGANSGMSMGQRLAQTRLNGAPKDDTFFKK